MDGVRKTRPEVTLFLSTSVDGKITSHDSDEFDANRLWKYLPGVRGVLQRFYDFSASTSIPFTTGLAMKKTGVNEKQDTPTRLQFSLIVFDNTRSLTTAGWAYMAACVKKLYAVVDVVTAKRVKFAKNVVVIPLKSIRSAPSNTELMRALWLKGVREITLHSSGPLNVTWIAEGLVDHVTLMVAPLFVGSNGTPVMMDLGAFPVQMLALQEAKQIGESYMYLRYDVAKSVEVPNLQQLLQSKRKKKVGNKNSKRKSMKKR